MTKRRCEELPPISAELWICDRRNSITKREMILRQPREFLQEIFDRLDRMDAMVHSI